MGYLSDLDARDEHQTDQEIADQLGVSENWVRTVRHEVVQSGRMGGNSDFATQEVKREIAKEYLRENPEASNREVASETPVSRTTVSTLKEELEEEEVPFEPIGPEEALQKNSSADELATQESTTEDNTGSSGGVQDGKSEGESEDKTNDPPEPFEVPDNPVTPF